jgi:signal transduction histidine kinase
VTDSTNDSKTTSPPDAEWLVNQIAHTLRNPIFAAMVQVESLVMRAGDDDRTANAAGLVHRQLKRLESNINEMLLYGRPPKLSPRRVQLVQVIEQVAFRFRQGEHDEPAQVEVDGPGEELELQIDPDAVTVILERLILNAVQHTPEPHQVQVHLALEGDDTVRLTVRDDGEGVSDSVREMMFLPFYPQHSGRPGLGLSVAAKFAQALGGSITIKSEEGKGTTAVVTIPVTPPSP